MNIKTAVRVCVLMIGVFALTLFSSQPVVGEKGIAAESWSACPAPEARQFDFWVGEWDVVNRRLTDDGKWFEAGTATTRVYSILDGCAIVEHWRGNLGERSIKGFSIRAYDPSAEKWNLLLNWPGKDRPSFGLLSGAFRHERGEFFTQGKDREGNDQLVRYTFSDSSPSSMRWDAAYSKDEGRTWFTNWIMEFSRRDPHSALPLFNGPTQSEDRCTFPEAREFDFFAGRWTGQLKAQGPGGAETASPVDVDSYLILEGCAVMDFATVWGEGEPYKKFFIRSFLPPLKRWVLYTIDNREPVFMRYEGEFEGDSIQLVRAGAEETEGASESYAWTLREDGTVRLDFRLSSDGGKTWTSVATADLQRKP